MGRKKKIITLTVLLALLIVGYYVYSTRLLLKWLLTTPVGAWLFVNTPLGAIFRLLYPPARPPTLTPEPWWEWTYQEPVIGKDDLASRVIIEFISLIKVANKSKIYTSRMPEIRTLGFWNALVPYENVSLSYNDREFISAYMNATMTCHVFFYPIGDLAEGRLRASENLRVRISYKTSIKGHLIGVSLPSPTNPEGGSSPSFLMTIADKYSSSNASSGVYLGRNLHINYLPSEWYTLDIKYLDVWPQHPAVWPSREEIIGWKVSSDFMSLEIPEGLKEAFIPKEPYIFAVGLDTALYEPSGLLKITVKNNLSQPIIAIIVKVGSEIINIPLIEPLDSNKSVSAELGLIRPLKYGEIYDVVVRAYYPDQEKQAIVYISKTMQVICREE